MVPTRAQAWTLLTEHTQSPHLVKHALGVEAAMRGYARRFGEDEELWGIVGLIHDLDYEEHPSLEEHPFVGTRILRELGWAEEIIHAVLGHSDHTGVERISRLDRTLYAVDELVGFIVAVALVRPSKSVIDLPIKSILKKFKDKAFCRAIDRDHLRGAAAELGVDMKEHMTCIVESLGTVAAELDLE
jgi:putative nucleotidyltransferase with HDIG domain